MATKRPALKGKRERALFTAADFKRTHRLLSEQIEILHRVMSYREVARQIGVDQRTVRRWASGETKKPASEQAVKLVKSGYDLVRKDAVERASIARRRKPGRAKRVKFIDPTDPKRERRVASDTVEIDLLGVSVGSIIGILKRYRNNVRLRGIPGITRFYLLGKDAHPEYPNEYFWGEPFELESLTNDEIEQIIGEADEDSFFIAVRIQNR